MRDLSMQVVKLLSQYIVSNPAKIPEGKVFQKTSCMNPDDAEVIGTIEAAKVFLDKDLDKDILEDLNKIQDFFEILGISRWTKGELTHLGFRAGTRYEEKTDVAQESAEEEHERTEVIDEAEILGDSSSSTSK